MGDTEKVKQDLVELLDIWHELYVTDEFPKIEDQIVEKYRAHGDLVARLKKEGYVPDDEYVRAMRNLQTMYVALCMGALLNGEQAARVFAPAINYSGFVLKEKVS